jgi:site-specific DNA-methyltransferase (adenine-specific)
MHGTDRQPDGSTTQINGMGRDVPNYGLRRNWWVVANPYTGETDGHPAPMPYSLAADHIQTWTVAGDTILDPFVGSGTAGVAAIKLGRKFIGIEIEPKYFDIACRRLEEASRQADMFIERPAPVKQEAFL